MISEYSKYEWDNTMKPKTSESLLLQLIKNIDSKMNLFTLAVDENSDSGRWTDTHNIFRTSLFKGSDDSK